eukprot:246919-Rhodomonas_salina.2
MEERIACWYHHTLYQYQALGKEIADGGRRGIAEMTSRRSDRIAPERGSTVAPYARSVPHFEHRTVGQYRT